MEDVKKTAQGETVSNTAAAAKAEAEQLKEKYKCRVYRVGITIPQDDSEEKEFAYYFKRPAIASYDRYLKSAAQQGIVKASKVFMLDCVTEESRDALIADMEEYPGIAVSVGNRLTEILGLTNANLKML
ncbi:hypothetical protein HMPREF0995_00596 [Lachnospiraceae bacterium 7_1_58FAA]|uniref:DUF6848 family protein n=1 Tax=Dysosmobacter welbionis TaxID=2093857 RepID=UPI000246C3AB|nr:hypothetical protein HMPREF0995_00596 [Lachnospiraceae bacterium 7_1_58FAA]